VRHPIESVGDDIETKPDVSEVDVVLGLLGLGEQASGGGANCSTLRPGVYTIEIEPSRVNVAERERTESPVSNENDVGSNHRGHGFGTAPIIPRWRRAALRHSPEARISLCEKRSKPPVWSR
jgi:hypothetical protein